MLAQGWFGFDSIFWLTVLVIFLAAITGAVLVRLRKDKCLKLLHDHHVTYLDREGKPLWGDVFVSSQGFELRYDAPYVNARGLAKSSFLVFADEQADAIALARTVHGLTEGERDRRERQIRETFDPSLGRRARRWLRNVVNTVRDAITKTFSLLVGALASRSEEGKAVSQRKGEVDELGQTLAGWVGNAYEPLLERHVGRPVVVQLRLRDGGPAEFPGYLVDYTERFVAVFNVDQAPEEALEIETEESTSRPGLTLHLNESRVELTCTGPDALVVHRVETGAKALDLGVVLLPHCRLDLPRAAGETVRVRAERTRRVDLVCPRARARVRHASEPALSRRPGWTGAAPTEAE